MSLSPLGPCRLISLLSGTVGLAVFLPSLRCHPPTHFPTGLQIYFS